MPEDKASLMPCEADCRCVQHDEVDADEWVDNYKKQQWSHMWTCAVLLVAFVMWWRYPAIQNSHFFRILAAFVCMLDAMCVHISFILYRRARDAAREGQGHQFVKDVLTLRTGPWWQKDTLALDAPMHLMILTMLLFMIEIVGYLFLSVPTSAEEQIPPFDIIDALSTQLFAVVCGVILGRSSRVIRNLGREPEPTLPTSQADAVAALQEKV